MESISLQSGAFTAEQKEYLAGFFTGAAQQVLRPFVGVTSSGLITSDASSGSQNLAEEEVYHGIEISDLCREERWKAEENPLDIWDKLVAHAEENKAPAADDLFRFKFHGLFHV